MNILVLHNNYPAQFKFLLPSLVACDHNVVFLSLESHGNKIPGVKHYKVGASQENTDQHWNGPYKGLGKKIKYAEIFRAAFQKLKDSDFYPDITIFHSGWGIGCFLKSVFPKTKSFAYAEWWFNWDSVEARYDSSSEYSPSSNLIDKVSLHYLNLTQASEIAEADFVWSPTRWQRHQFPFSIQKRMEIIHEGVDTSLFKPSNQPFDTNHPIHITYTSRALEPMRCYNHFYKIIVPIMKLYPSIHLTIVGKSKAVYRPTFSKTSLYEESFKYFENHDLMHRITHYERLDTAQYSKLLSKSQLHFYLSRPFVASWSLLEAMSSGCSIISNITPMTAEFLNHKKNALLVDSVDTKKSVNDIKGFFADKDLIDQMAANAREYALGFSYQKQLKALKSFIGY